MQKPDLIPDDLHLSDNVFASLRKISQWARFLAIMGFIVVGMMIIGAFVLPTLISYSYSEFEGVIKADYGKGMTVNFLLLAVLLFFPCLFLFRFAVKMKEALMFHMQQPFEESFSNLKATFKFYGILAIIILCIYALTILTFVITAIFSR